MTSAAGRRRRSRASRFRRRKNVASLDSPSFELSAICPPRRRCGFNIEGESLLSQDASVVPPPASAPSLLALAIVTAVTVDISISSWRKSHPLSEEHEQLRRGQGRQTTPPF